MAPTYYKHSLMYDKDSPQTLIYYFHWRILNGEVDDGLELVKKGQAIAAKDPKHRELTKRAKLLLDRYKR
jgi:hypothetical protein